MPNFCKAMAERLKIIEALARSTRRYCAHPDVEGCLVYDDLLKLQRMVMDAITFYASDVPACDREAIVRMVAADRAEAMKSC